jgi:two-component system phosphate regulon response regulator PhoB
MTKKVMLADDEEGVRILVAAILGSEGPYELILARDGEEALQMAQQEKPDLLFLDVLMPKLDGYEVCRALKGDGDTASIKIIMLSALAQESDRQRALEMGADDYITKPFSPAAFLGKVKEVLEG